MRHSDPCKKILEKLAQVAATIDQPKKRCQGQVGPRKYMYADLDATYDCCLDKLSDNHLFLSHTTNVEEGQPVLETRITDLDSMEWVAAVMLLPEPTNMQSYGSAITYARRYTLQPLLRMLGQDDDDGAGDRQAQEKRPSFEDVMTLEITALAAAIGANGHPDPKAEADMRVAMILGPLGFKVLEDTYNAPREEQGKVYHAVTAEINKERGLA